LGSFPAVFTQLVGSPIEALVVVQADKDIEKSRLIMFLDSGSGLPIVPNGGKIEFAWPDNIIAAL